MRQESVCEPYVDGKDSLPQNPLYKVRISINKWGLGSSDPDLFASSFYYVHRSRSILDQGESRSPCCGQNSRPTVHIDLIDPVGTIREIDGACRDLRGKPEEIQGSGTGGLYAPAELSR
jgi:hypothetical protein